MPLAKYGVAVIFGSGLWLYINHFNKGGSVKRLRSPSSTAKRILALILLFIISIFWAHFPASGAEESNLGKPETPPANEPIEITADKLVSNNQEKFAEFSGNVKANQGKFTINSDRLRIYYQGNLVNPEEKSSGEEKINNIVAQGNVKITAEQYYAETDKVEYNTESMTIVLTGENSKVTSGKNSITGSKITLYRKDGRIKVEGSSTKRIKAVFYSQGDTSEAFSLEKSKNSGSQ